MRVLIINASPRQTGATSALLDEFAAALGGHEVERFRLREHDFAPCTGCLRCRPDGACVLPRDGAHELAEAFARNDAVVIGTPVYWGNMPGPLKTFFDRNVTLLTDNRDEGGWNIPKPRLNGKRAVIIASGIAPFPANYLMSEARGAIRTVRRVFSAAGMRISGTLNVASSDEFERVGDRYLRRARAMAGALVVGG